MLQVIPCNSLAGKSAGNTPGLHRLEHWPCPCHRAPGGGILWPDRANSFATLPGSSDRNFRNPSRSHISQPFFWSISVNNILNALYYDYAVESLFTPGRFSAYPLPGRTYMVKAGATF